MTDSIEKIAIELANQLGGTAESWSACANAIARTLSAGASGGGEALAALKALANEWRKPAFELGDSHDVIANRNTMCRFISLIDKLTPASPATGHIAEHPLYAEAFAATPQPESAQDDELEWLRDHLSRTLSSAQLDRANAILSILAAAPQPQQAPAQEGGWKKMTDEARKLQMRHLDKHEGDVYHAMQWLVTKFGAKDSGPLFVPAAPPAHGDGEGMRLAYEGRVPHAGDTYAFMNFHRALCERFGYTHDSRDWRRDQVSLIEHIAKLTARPAPEADARDGVALRAGRAFNPGDRVEWQSSFGDWFPAKIVAVKDGITTYTAKLDDGTTATDFAAGRFRKLAMSLPAQGREGDRA